MPPRVALSPQATNWLAQFRLVWGEPLKPPHRKEVSIYEKKKLQS